MQIYLEDFREEASTNVLEIEVIKAIKRRDRVFEGLARGASASFGGSLLEVTDRGTRGVLKFRRSPQVLALFPVLVAARHRLQLGRKPLAKFCTVLHVILKISNHILGVLVAAHRRHFGFHVEVCRPRGDLVAGLGHPAVLSITLRRLPRTGLAVLETEGFWWTWTFVKHLRGLLLQHPRLTSRPWHSTSEVGSTRIVVHRP